MEVTRETHSYSTKISNTQAISFVPETRFGLWFLSTETWLRNVLKVAVRDLERLFENRKSSYPTVLDIGCGQGQSLKLLQDTYSPKNLIALEYDTETLDIAKRRALKDNLNVKFLQNDCSQISLPDNSVDLVFCHQVFHHLILQEESLREFHRVLKPGGVLLFAESTKAYIHSWLIRYLFAHPMELQRTSHEYLQMLKAAGFKFNEKNISYPYLWWSRSDIGFLEWIGIKPKPFGHREETLVNLVAQKPN